MKKVLPITVFALAMSLLSGCSNSAPKTSVDKDIKLAFLNCKQKVDIVKNSISELTMNESGEYNNRNLLKRSTFKYSDLAKDRYLTLQNFGLYVLNNVYHCITYDYDSENVSIEETIYDEVQNELDGNLRNYLKTSNQTSKFYMQIEKNENDYSFQVDWLGTQNMRGNIYVGGKIELNGKEATKFTITSFTEDKSNYIFSAHYDFVANNFYMFNASHYKDSEVDLSDSIGGFIDKLNNNQLTTRDLEEIGYSNFSLANGKITKNINEINYHGYVRDEYYDGANKDDFDNLFNLLKNEISHVKVRTSKDAIDYSKNRRVHFMDNALKYGLDTTKLYVSSNGSAMFSFVTVDDFIQMCDNVPENFKPLFSKVKTKLESQTGKDKSLEFEDDEIKISTTVANEQYYSLNTYWVDKFYYTVVDKTEDVTIQFSIKGNSLYGVRSTNSDYVPDDDPNYEEEIRVLTGFSREATEQFRNGVVASFNEKYKGKYKISLESSGSSQDLIHRIVTTSEAGAVDGLPEIMISYATSLENVVKNDASRKYLYNFDSFISDEKIGLDQDELAKFDQTMLDDCNNYSVEGRWSLPFSSDDFYLLYDKTYFEGENKQFDLPQTFEDMIEIATEIKNNRGNDFIPIYVNSDSQFIINLMLQKDIPFISSDYTLDYASSENRDVVINLFGELKQYVTSGIITSRSINNQQPSDMINNNSCVFAIAPAPALKYVRNENFKVAAIPFANNNQVYARNTISSISLLKTGKPYATRGAWLFIKEMLSSFAIEHAIDNYSRPSIKYETSDITASGLKKDIAIMSNQIADKYVTTPKAEKIDDIYNDILNHLLSDLLSNNPETVYEDIVMRSY